MTRAQQDATPKPWPDGMVSDAESFINMCRADWLSAVKDFEDAKKAQEVMGHLYDLKTILMKYRNLWFTRRGSKTGRLTSALAMHVNTWTNFSREKDPSLTGAKQWRNHLAYWMGLEGFQLSSQELKKAIIAPRRVKADPDQVLPTKEEVTTDFIQACEHFSAVCDIILEKVEQKTITTSRHVLSTIAKK